MPSEPNASPELLEQLRRERASSPKSWGNSAKGTIGWWKPRGKRRSAVICVERFIAAVGSSARLLLTRAFLRRFSVNSSKARAPCGRMCWTAWPRPCTPRSASSRAAPNGSRSAAATRDRHMPARRLFYAEGVKHRSPGSRSAHPGLPVPERLPTLKGPEGVEQGLAETWMAERRFSSANDIRPFFCHQSFCPLRSPCLPFSASPRLLPGGPDRSRNPRPVRRRHTGNRGRCGAL